MLVEQYLKIEQTIRQKHLNLNDSCIERGGNSTNHRGVLAQYLDTPIYGRPADLCHACNNPNCSNPKHLYWGTRKENVKDSIEFGSWSSPYDKMVKKYGEDKAKEICKNNIGDSCSRGGKAGKGKPKSPEHIAKFTASRIRNMKINGGVT